MNIPLSPRILLCGACALLLTFCASQAPYRITLKDGREFMAASRPEFNGKTGYYKFRTDNDKDALIRADEILMINEL